MIQKAMLGIIEPEEERELQRIDRQLDARNKGQAIQMPPLPMALVELYREFARTNRAMKDMGTE